ncbi:MAG: autotransporter protein [Bryobacterales bacterium]|nr:autotransporter protein [Bryobacterales bacterium]
MNINFDNFFSTRFCASGGACTRTLRWIRLLVPLAISFVAVHQASADDTAAVQAAINNCPNGGTVTFPAGTYNIGSTLTLKANCTYQGQGNPVFLGYQGNGSGGYVIAQIHQQIQNIVITGITFDGGGLFFDANDQKGGNVTITNSTFRHIQNTNGWNDVAHMGIYLVGWGFGHVTITNNVFQDITYGNNNYNTDWIAAINGDWVSSALSVEMADSYDINDNTFRNMGSNAIKMPPNSSLTPHPGPYNILRNNFYQIHRMAIENQEGYSGFCVNSLKVDNNVLHSFVSPYWDTMGISVMPWCAVNSEVSQNQIYLSPIGPAVPENHGSGDYNYAIGIEMGLNRADGNIIQSMVGDPGPAWFMSIAISGAVISNNAICGPTKNSPWYGYDSGGGAKQPATFTNNTYTATCASSTGPSITTASALPAGVVGTAYSQVFAGSGGTTPYTWYQTGGSLPPGLALSPAGALSGTPTAAGTWNFTVKLTDSSSQTVTGAFSLTVPTAAAAPLTIGTTSPLPGGSMTVPYSDSLTAAGGTAPYAWAVSSGTLPPGLSLSAAGVISGTPTAAGTFSFVLRATDHVAATATKTINITVSVPSGGGVISDEFNTTPINSSLWALVAPAGGSQSTTGTAVQLVAPGGSTHDPNDSTTNNAVRLEQSISNVDFNVVAKFNSLPSVAANSYNGEGIMVSSDASNFLRFEVYSNQTSGYQIYASSTAASVQGNPFINAALPVTAGSFYLRVGRAGNVWTESWSTDGVNYTTSGTFTQAISTAKTGPYVTNYATTAAATPSNVATVDFFRRLP